MFSESIKSIETNTNQSFQGMVIRKNRGQYLVQVDGHNLSCGLSNRLRKQLFYPTAAPSSLRHRVQSVEELDVIDPVAIGDQVTFLDAGDGTGLITTVLPRRNALSRRAALDKRAPEQVLVANADQVVAVFAAAQPPPKWALLDRYLVQAEAAGLQAVVCITKTDLIRPGDLDEDLDLYRRIGYRVILTSATTGIGIQEASLAFSGRISILMGKSGVGKSSLLNAIQPGLGLRVNAVGDGIGKGRHTTTHLELFLMAGGGGVVDTPGMREFTLWDVSGSDLAQYFPEMRPYLGRCQFGASCEHDNEPGCAIRKAVTSGKISYQRYQSYLKLSLE